MTNIQLEPWTRFFSRCRALSKLGARRLDPRVVHIRRENLNRIGSAFVDGMNLAQEVAPNQLPDELAKMPALLKGINYEGAMAALAQADIGGESSWLLSKALLDAAPEHAVLLYMGLGGGLAHAGVEPDMGICGLDPLWGWFVLDGYGFHQAYFRWYETIDKQVLPPGLHGMSQKAFDQGVGRGIYFVGGANPRLVNELVGKFAPERRPDLWAGIGIVCSYSGGPADCTDLKLLANKAGAMLPHLQKGVVVGTKARVDQGHVADHTDGSCNVICGASVSEVHRMADKALLQLSDQQVKPEYESWQKLLLEFLDD